MFRIFGENQQLCSSLRNRKATFNQRNGRQTAVGQKMTKLY